MSRHLEDQLFVDTMHTKFRNKMQPELFAVVPELSFSAPALLQATLAKIANMHINWTIIFGKLLASEHFSKPEICINHLSGLVLKLHLHHCLQQLELEVPELKAIPLKRKHHLEHYLLLRNSDPFPGVLAVPKISDRKIGNSHCEVDNLSVLTEGQHLLPVIWEVKQSAFVHGKMNPDLRKFFFPEVAKYHLHPFSELSTAGVLGMVLVTPYLESSHQTNLIHQFLDQGALILQIPYSKEDYLQELARTELLLALQRSRTNS